MTVIRDFARSPLVWVIAAWHAAWGAIALATDARVLIDVLNFFVLGIAIGVIVAYLPNVVRACRKARPNGAEILTVSIWGAWVSLLEARLLSIVWRLVGRPDWLANTDITSHIVSLALLSGIGHLAGPEAIDGRVPAREWVRIGFYVSVGLIVAVGLMITLGETGALLQRR